VSANRIFLLMGSGEFEPWSAEVERAALEGRPQRVAVCPAASAPEGEGTYGRWARMGLEHYGTMGVPAAVVPLRTREDAEGEAAARALDDVGMVFFSGGNPRYLADTLRGTRFWSALEAALDAGVVFAGCSAGAMIASRGPDARPRLGTTWVSGLGLVPEGSFGVHWDRVRFIPGMRGFVMSRASGGWFAGIDERTAILGDGSDWRVYGLGGVALRMDGTSHAFRAGERFSTTG
jgi:cyanophycinase-like exopeptidase